MSAATTMFAWLYRSHGDPTEVLKKEERPVPQPSPTQVLVQVKCAALNPIGYKAMKFFPSLMVTKPCIPESDLSGIVIGKGQNVTSVNVGDEVIGFIPAESTIKTRNGALSQYAVVESDFVTRKPQNLSWQEAAAVPLTSLTALESFQFAGLKDGQRVFVNGGSGGVGTNAIQIAKSYNAFVVASCSEANVALVKRLGADEVVDYKSVDVPTYLAEKYGSQKFDVILDTVGSFPNELFHKCPAYLNENGTFVQVGAPGEGMLDQMKGLLSIGANSLLPTFLGGTNRKYKFLLLKPTKDTMSRIGELLHEGKLKPQVDSVHSFDDALKAYERLMSNRAKGKVVVNVSE